MTAPIRRGMALAAGLGLRMRPITERMPKPLVPVGGRTMLDRVLDHFDAYGLEQIVVNTHYKGEMIRDHLASRRDILLSHEELLLETGGGVRKALPHLGPDAFFVANSDILWTDGPRPALTRLAEAWDGTRMDALLLLQPTATAYGYDGAGDFSLGGDGRPRRRRDGETTPFLFAGVQILHPRLFADSPEGKFSLNVVYDRALAQGRLSAIVHDGAWYHVGTPAALDEVNGLLAAGD